MSSLPSRHRREEIINSITHGAGLMASIAGAVTLVGMAAGSSNPRLMPSVLIYCTSLILVYLSSTIYHAVDHPGRKSRLQTFDHCSVYLLIAGTYTPLLLLGIGGRVEWTLFALVWAMAVAGIVFKFFFTGRWAAASLATYLAMGWVAVVAGRPVAAALPPETVQWVVAGGLAYTVGTVAFLSQRPYAHSLWHVFVIAGSACHYVAIIGRVALS